MVEEEVLNKAGPELFREVLRVYPVAEVEDYFKGGAWRDELMKTDLQLVEAHRKEAGAPEPPALEDVKMPEMPTAVAPAMMLPGGVRPPMMAGAGGMAVPQVARPVAAPAGGAAVAGGPAAELRLIALFVAKWKLDPTRTKMILAKLTPARRRYVIQHFKATAGADPSASLAQFVATCENTNAWAAATAGAAPATAGMKRPLAPTMMANPALDPSKRPRLISAITQQRPPVARPAVAPGMRPAAPGMIRPVAVRPGAVRPMAPRAKVAGQPGALIKNLLQRF